MRKLLAEIAPLQRLLVEEPQGRDGVFRSKGESLLVKQVELMAPQFFGTQMFGRTAEVLGKLLHHADVAADRVGRVVAPPEIIQHALTPASQAMNHIFAA